MLPLRPLISGTYGATRQAGQLVSLRARLDDMNRQLSTGQRAESLGGLERGRATALTMRARLAETTAYSAVIARGAVRLDLMNGALDQMRSLSSAARSDALAASSAPTVQTIAASRSRAMAGLDEAIAALNSEFDGQYLFSGRSSDIKPVAASSVMLQGDASGDGLLKLIDERRQADLGTGLGRLAVGGSGTMVALSEEAAGLPFGFRITHAATTVQGAALAGPTGAPAAVTLDLSMPPVAGQKLELTLALPDGTSETIALTADTAAPAYDSSGRFATSADPATAAGNLRAALAARLGALAGSSLAAASSMTAAADFFAGSATTPARRIDGPPFSTATAYAAPGARPTALWYRGDDEAGIAARQSQQIGVQRGVTLAVGARASEQPFVAMLTGLASLAADTGASTPAPPAAYRALAERSAEALAGINGPAGRAVIADFAVATEVAGKAVVRHSQMSAVFNGVIADIEQPSLEEVSASILSLQTRLQASYQVTASLSQLSLAPYL